MSQFLGQRAWQSLKVSFLGQPPAHMRKAFTACLRSPCAISQSPPGSFRVLVRASMPLELAHSTGGPVEVWLDIASPAGDDRLLYDVLWVNKTATRLPEVCTACVTL